MGTTTTDTNQLKKEAIMSTQPLAARQHTASDVQKLRNAVKFMDCLSQSGFSEISSIAKLALCSLETPDGYRHLNDIANALKTILDKADDTQNCINIEAEQVGCSYADESQHRLWNAQCVAINKPLHQSTSSQII